MGDDPTNDNDKKAPIPFSMIVAALGGDEELALERFAEVLLRCEQKKDRIDA